MRLCPNCNAKLLRFGWFFDIMTPVYYWYCLDCDIKNNIPYLWAVKGEVKMNLVIDKVYHSVDGLVRYRGLTTKDEELVMFFKNEISDCFHYVPIKDSSKYVMGEKQ